MRLRSLSFCSRTKNRPFALNIRLHVNCRHKTFDQFALAAQNQAGANCPVNAGQNFLVLTVTRFIFGHQHQNVINIDVHLPDQFNFKDQVVLDACFLGFFPGPPVW